MSLAIDVRFDVSALEAWSGKTVHILRNGLRSAVDKSARAARNDTLQVLSDDLNVPLPRLKSVLPTVRGSTQSDLTATWSIGGNASMIRPAGGGEFNVGKLGSVTGSTFRLTGGGSAALGLKRAFVIRGRNGGTVVMTRFAKGKGGIKAIYAGRASTDMAQSDSVPRLTWESSAEKNLGGLASAAVAKAFALDASELPDRIGLSVTSREVAR